MKAIPVFFATLFLFFSPTSFALDGNGQVTEIRTCTPGNNWRNYVQFKLSDGNWFSVYAIHHGGTNNYNDTVHPAMIMMAFTAGYVVDVRGNAGFINCGGVNAQMIYMTAGDYIHIVKD